MDRDLAIIELSSPVVFSESLSPICLPDKSKSYDAELVTVAGWGKLGTSQGQPRILQKVISIKSPDPHNTGPQVDLNTMDNGRCVRDFVWASSQITSNMICANSAEDKDICQGDSGGPMMANEGAYYSVIGNTSSLL